MNKVHTLFTSPYRHPQWHGIAFYLALTLAFLLSTSPVLAETQDNSLIVIDTTKRTLAVLQNGKTKATFDNISIGKGGPAKLRKRGDAKTPLGEFRIVSINRKSRYYLFFGIDYPNLDYAERAYDANIIDEDEYREIYRAVKRNSMPPQNTKLGGHIGIHGVGRGDLEIHQTFNWTDGCIALTNEQINQLAKWINIGTKVIISS